MKKSILFCAGCYICTSALAQQTANPDSRNVSQSTIDYAIQKDYSSVDTYVRSITKNYTDIYELANDLTGNYTREEDKLRAIYIWIVNNISFDYKDLKRGVTTAQRIYCKYRNNGDYYYAFAKQILKTKKAVCIGYSALFFELCKVSGIKCVIIEGAADNNIKKIAYYRRTYFYYPNHAWNKVLINNYWYFIDVTWSSGSCNSKKYYKNFQEQYYLTSVNNLYETHVENKY
jgi:transglutaminase/protease-like cytokinesis protein 3